MSIPLMCNAMFVLMYNTIGLTSYPLVSNLMHSFSETSLSRQSEMPF